MATRPTATIGSLFVTLRARMATANVRMTAPAIAAAAIGLNLVSSRAIGLLTGRPLASLPPEANCSGTWILTSSTGTAGTVITILHLGQGPFLPANFSLTEKRALQPGHITEIGMASGSRNEAREDVLLVSHSRKPSQEAGLC